MRVLMFCFLFITVLWSQGEDPKIGLYTAEEWQTVIDTTWKEDLPTETKLHIFDSFWNYIDDEYPGFINLDVNWDSLTAVFRPEIETGVSRGRFFAIIGQLLLALQDDHSNLVDPLVSLSATADT